MDSSGQNDPVPRNSTFQLGSLLGVVIALLTLLIPIVAIAYFSSDEMNLNSVSSIDAKGSTEKGESLSETSQWVS